MKKVSKKDLVFLEKLMAKYNDYSELVALNYYKKAEDGILQWNRGIKYSTEELLNSFADMLGINLIYSLGTHPFLDFELEYTTVHLEGEDTTYHRIGCCDIKVR